MEINYSIANDWKYLERYWRCRVDAREMYFFLLLPFFNFNFIKAYDFFGVRYSVIGSNVKNKFLIARVLNSKKRYYEIIKTLLIGY